MWEAAIFLKRKKKSDFYQSIKISVLLLSSIPSSLLSSCQPPGGDQSWPGICV